MSGRHARFLAWGLVTASLAGWLAGALYTTWSQTNLKFADRLVLHVYVEDGLEADFFAKVVEMGVAFVADAGALPRPRVVLGDTFDDDGRSQYWRNNTLPPVSLRAESETRPPWDALDGSLDVNVILYNGTGGDFLGLADCFNWIVLLPSVTPFALALAPLVMQEFGHILGLAHNRDSRIMDGADIRNFTSLLRLNTTGVSSFVRGEIPQVGSIWDPWAVPTGVFQTEDAVTTSVFRQVIFRHRFSPLAFAVLAGGQNTEIATGNRTDFLVWWETHSEAWVSAWAHEELRYLRSWRDWLPTSPPAPNPSEGRERGECYPAQIAASYTLGDPRFWLVSSASAPVFSVGLWLLHRRMREPGIVR